MLYAHVLHVFQVFFPTGVTGADDPTKFWPREFQGGWIGWIWLNHQPETNLDSQGREILIDLIDCCCVLSTWKLSHSCGVLYLLMPPMACLIACPAGRSSVSYKQPIGLLFKTTFLVVDSLTNSKSTFWPLRPRFLMLKKFQAPNIHCQKWRCRFEPALWSSLPFPHPLPFPTPRWPPIRHPHGTTDGLSQPWPLLGSWRPHGRPRGAGRWWKMSTAKRLGRGWGTLWSPRIFAPGPSRRRNLALLKALKLGADVEWNWCYLWGNGGTNMFAMSAVISVCIYIYIHKGFIISLKWSLSRFARHAWDPFHDIYHTLSHHYYPNKIHIWYIGY